jgi:antitoxin component HigA of HigAB toxin-antitoxin module
MTEKSQRTVYLEEDVEDWIAEVAEYHDQNFSEQVSQLLKFARTKYDEEAPEDEQRIVKRAQLKRKIARLEDELEQNPPPEES